MPSSCFFLNPWFRLLFILCLSPKAAIDYFLLTFSTEFLNEGFLLIIEFIFSNNMRFYLYISVNRSYCNMSFFLLLIIIFVGSYNPSFSSGLVKGRIPLRFCLWICRRRYYYLLLMILFEYGVPLNILMSYLQSQTKIRLLNFSYFLINLFIFCNYSLYH